MSMNKKGMRFPIYPTRFGSCGRQKDSQMVGFVWHCHWYPCSAPLDFCAEHLVIARKVYHILSYTSRPDLGSTWLTSTEAFDMQFWPQVMVCLVFWLCHNYGATAAKLMWSDPQASARTADGFDCPRHQEVWWHQTERDDHASCNATLDQWIPSSFWLVKSTCWLHGWV
jgi:hypothetical protein